MTGPIATVAGACLVASLLPLIPVAHGLVRSFDFARLQVIAVSGLALAAGLVLVLVQGDQTPVAVASMAMAFAALVIQTIHVLPFTPVWTKQTKRYDGQPDQTATISLLVCNVKQGNRDYAKVTGLLEERQPDIAVFMETDKAWVQALLPHLDDYSETLACPLSNSYGMLFASRAHLREQEVRFLLNDEVPSISCVISLGNGEDVRIVALHPEPPVPTRDTKGRDAEILLVGEEARSEPLPMIVTGDLNDVAWSRTTRRFLRISRLLDPRQGRGLFNSFDARRWYLRWPLDHIFHSRDFELVEIERLPPVGSDHFPMFYRFALTDTNRNRPPPPASEGDLAEADETVACEKQRERAPVGTDWE